MNWGLFAALAGFLLPLAVALRLFFNIVTDERPLGHPLKALRFVALMFTMVPVSGKIASLLFALTGWYGDVGQLTIDFMVTPWGLVHLGFTFAAVLSLDLFAPRIVEQLEAVPASRARPRAAYLIRDAGILVLLLALAWLGAR